MLHRNCFVAVNGHGFSLDLPGPKSEDRIRNLGPDLDPTYGLKTLIGLTLILEI